jgi:hypothetical protein
MMEVFGFSFCYFVFVLFCFVHVEKAWGIAGPPVLSAIGRAGSRNPD